MINKLAIIGSGDLGQLIAYHALNDRHAEEIVFFDDTVDKGTITEQGVVVGNIDSIHEMFNLNYFEKIIIAIGYKHFHARQIIFERLNGLIPFASIIHSSSYVDNSVRIGEGVVILPGCILDKGVCIGNNVLFNIGVTIAHDSKIMDHSFIAPNVSIAGFVIVKERCMLGINTIIIDNIKIEDDIITGGGTVVVKNISERGLYVGVPAKKIKDL